VLDFICNIRTCIFHPCWIVLANSVLAYSYHPSISPLSTVCLVCNVQSTKFIIALPSNKWVALTRAGLCVLCVVDYPASSIRWVVFHKVVCQHYSGEVGKFLLLWFEIFSWFCTPKIIKIGSSLRSYSKYKRKHFLINIIYFVISISQ